MEKTKFPMLAILILFGIAAITFSILYFNEKNDLSAATIKRAKDDSTNSKYSTNHTVQEILKLFNSAPIDYQHMQDLAIHFHNSFDPGYTATTPGKIPYAVWVDKTLIIDLLKTKNIDGFRIIPLQYVQNETVGGQQFNQDQVSFGIVLTHPNTTGTGDPHTEDPADAFDYNQPCPHPPCN
jgi:hypothetical protein